MFFYCLEVLSCRYWPFKVGNPFRAQREDIFTLPPELDERSLRTTRGEIVFIHWFLSEDCCFPPAKLNDATLGFSELDIGSMKHLQSIFLPDDFFEILTLDCVTGVPGIWSLQFFLISRNIWNNFVYRVSSAYYTGFVMWLIWLMNHFTQLFPCIFHPCMSLVALLQGKGSRLWRCTVWLVDCKNLLMLSKVQQMVLLLTKSLSLFTIIERGWAKYRDLSVASRSFFCQTQRLRQIIDRWDTKKSRYSTITEFNNCFIIPLLLFWLTRDVKLLSFSHKS